MQLNSLPAEVKRHIFVYLDDSSLSKLYATLDRNMHRFYASKGAISVLKLSHRRQSGLLRLISTVISDVDTLELREAAWSAHALSSLLRRSNPRQLTISCQLLPQLEKDQSDLDSLARVSDFNEFGLPLFNITCPRLEHLYIDNSLDSVVIPPSNPSTAELSDLSFALRSGAILSLPPSLSSFQLQYLLFEHQNDLIAALPESLERLNVSVQLPGQIHLLDYLAKFKSLVSLVAHGREIFIPKDADMTELSVSPFLETLQLSHSSTALPKDLLLAPWFRKLPITSLTLGISGYFTGSQSCEFELFPCLPASITSLTLDYSGLEILLCHGRAFPAAIRSLDLHVTTKAALLQSLVHLVNLESLRLNCHCEFITEADFREKRLPPYRQQYRWSDNDYLHFRMLPPNLTRLNIHGVHSQCLEAPLIEELPLNLRFLSVEDAPFSGLNKLMELRPMCLFVVKRAINIWRSCKDSQEFRIFLRESIGDDFDLMAIYNEIMRLYCSHGSKIEICYNQHTDATSWDEFKDVQAVGYHSRKRPPWKHERVLPSIQYLRTVFPSLVSIVDNYSDYEGHKLDSTTLPPTMTHYGLLNLRIDIKSPLPSTLTSISSEVEILSHGNPLTLENFPNLIDVYAPKWTFTVRHLETWHPRPMKRFWTCIEAINDSDVLHLLQKFQPETRQNIRIHMFYVETGQLLSATHQISEEEEERGSRCPRLAERRRLSDAKLNRILLQPIKSEAADQPPESSTSSAFTPMSLLTNLELDKMNSNRRKLRSARKLLSFD